MVKNLFFKSDKSPKNIQIKKDIITHFISTGNDTISELSKILDLSVPTITKFITELMEQGLIAEFGKVHTPGGRHPIVYGLNPTSAYFVGVDMTRHHLHIALMDFTGNIVEKQFGISYIYENTPESLDQLCNYIQNFIDRTGERKQKIFNVNLNISGRVNPESGYSYSSFYFNERPVSETLSNRLKYNVGIDNDTRAMAFGEYMKGVVDGDLEALRELLYKVGVSHNAVHIERKMHRPLSQNSPVEDYIIYYTPRKDDYWIKNHASVEQMIDASEKGMREDLMRIKNDVSVGESGGGFREMTLGVDEEQL